FSGPASLRATPLPRGDRGTGPVVRQHCWLGLRPAMSVLCASASSRTSNFSSIRICMTVLLTKRGRLALSRHALLFHGLEDVRYGVVSVRELVSASRAVVVTRFRRRAPTVFPVVRGAVAFAVNVTHRSA